MFIKSAESRKKFHFQSIKEFYVFHFCFYFLCRWTECSLCLPGNCDKILRLNSLAADELSKNSNFSTIKISAGLFEKHKIKVNLNFIVWLSQNFYIALSRAEILTPNLSLSRAALSGITNLRKYLVHYSIPKAVLRTGELQTTALKKG